MRIAAAFISILLGAGAASADACEGIACSRHGACMVEARVPFCLCDEGYAADGLRCVRARRTREPVRSVSTGNRVLYVALSQNNRGVQQVGGFDAPPYELSRYVRPGQMWCSEFISWVYASAGVPFTGGYEGGWLLTNNRAIRRWFERRSLYVAAGTPEWRTFQPQTGDYVRLHTRRGHGHSAVVRYVIGETLYTVEGNVGHRVRLRAHRNFRNDRRIDGIGILTLPEERRAQLRRGPAVAVLPPRRATGDVLGDRPLVPVGGVRPNGVPTQPARGARAGGDDRPRRAGRARPRPVRRVQDHGAGRRAGRREPRA